MNERGRKKEIRKLKIQEFESRPELVVLLLFGTYLRQSLHSTELLRIWECIFGIQRFSASSTCDRSTGSSSRAAARPVRRWEWQLGLWRESWDSGRNKNVIVMDSSEQSLKLQEVPVRGAKEKLSRVARQRRFCHHRDESQFLLTRRNKRLIEIAERMATKHNGADVRPPNTVKTIKKSSPYSDSNSFPLRRLIERKWNEMRIHNCTIVMSEWRYRAKLLSELSKHKRERLCN